MAKDTEKLIRQLSLISFLMAERRPVTASEIRQVVEGYSDMNEDAFARRFYADRAELESLGIELTVDKPIDGAAEQENYSLPPENFFLSPIEFTDDELARLGTALALLDGEFAYAEPLRLALQQISWGRPSPLGAPDQRSVALGITASAGGHDLSQRLADFDPREYPSRIHWQFGDADATGEVWIAERVAWQVERHFGRYGSFRPEDGGVVFATEYASPRGLVSWVLGLGEHARILGPAELVEEYEARVARLLEGHSGAFETAPPVERVRSEEEPAEPRGRADKREAAIRPERLARLVTLATILIQAGRTGGRVPTIELCDQLQVSEQELREDLGVLNVVNFGAGAYILFAEMTPDGWVDVDPDAYADSFARPARLLPVEAKALVSAIDLIGDHLPSGSLASARAKVVAALGRDPVEEGLQVVPPTGEDTSVAGVVSRAVADHRMLGFEYYKENEDELTRRLVEPYALMNGREGWYLVAWDPQRDGVRHFRRDRIRDAAATVDTFEPRPEVDPAADIDGWPRTGEVPASRRARVWVSPERARWAREEREVAEDLADGSTVVEIAFAGTDWLVREVLKEAGDAVVLEPEDAREAVRAAVERLPQPAGRS